MILYCIKCLMLTKSRNIKIKRKIDGKINLYFCCIDSGFKKFETIDEEELSYSLKGLINCKKMLFFWRYKMNEIVNKFLLAGDKFMSEMILKQPEFTCSACGPFTKNKNTKL